MRLRVCVLVCMRVCVRVRVCVHRGKGDSHCPRDFSYKDATKQLDVSGMDAVIGLRQLDDGGWEMLVEPRVTMEQLVRAAAPYNLRPPVVPEFRKITVGGSIAGVAGESSSFKHGFFHDACTGYEVVTGDGSIITATPDNQYADLFFGVYMCMDIHGYIYTYMYIYMYIHM